MYKLAVSPLTGSGRSVLRKNGRGATESLSSLLEPSPSRPTRRNLLQPLSHKFLSISRKNGIWITYFANVNWCFACRIFISDWKSSIEVRQDSLEFFTTKLAQTFDHTFITFNIDWGWKNELEISSSSFLELKKKRAWNIFFLSMFCSMLIGQVSDPRNVRTKNLKFKTDLRDQVTGGWSVTQ